MGRLRLPFVVVALSALLAAAPAAASPRLKVGIQDDAWLAFGPGALEERLTRLESLNVEIVRLNLQWNRIARSRPAVPRDPFDPAYDWGAASAVLEGLRARGIPAVVGLVGAPAWANGGRGPAWIPRSAAAFANFAYAAQKRFPWVRLWLVWNEPNQRRWLRPTSPRLYVDRLLNPAHRALKQANPRALVGGGVTGPRGGRQYGGVSPVDFIRGMDAAGARLDAYAHHPYPLDPRETPWTGGCSHCETITMATLERLQREVGLAFGRKRIWLTEYAYQTDRFGVSPRLQARYLTDGVRRAYAAARVDMLVHFLYRDEPGVERWQSGLERADGTPKPALRAFRLAAARF